MNSTVNNSSCSFLPNPTARKIGETFAYCLIFVVSLLGNSFIGIVVYKTQILRKPINYFVVNMAMSDLVYPIFLFPRNITWLYVDNQWLISGALGQTLCKLVPFLGYASAAVSIQSLLLIAVDRLGAVVFPLRSPLISSKMCPFFILATWIVAAAGYSPYLIALKLVEDADGKQYCKMQWNEVSFFAYYILAGCFVLFYFPIALLIILYSIIVIKLKAQKIPGEQSDNAEKQRNKKKQKRAKDGHCYRGRVCTVLGTREYYLLTKTF